jgi:photosystem II stability/assembly factor-like uncharacterized protein
VSLRALLLLAVLGSAPAAAQTAEPARLAAHGLLLALAAAGERLVAVGDRGVIVYSEDRGTSWTQSLAVPTQALLTGVCFFDARHGVAVGHDLVALSTADAGRSWQRTHYDPAAQRPLLDVWCGSDGHAIAVGAYSTYLTSEDAGASWQEHPFHPVPAPARAAGAAKPGPPPADGDAGSGGFHLNRIVGAGAGRLYIAAEAGHLYRSLDGGAQWRELPSPYEGSFFGALPLGGEVVLAYGLRGNLYRSADGGDSWQKLDTGTLAMLDGGARLGSDGAALVGLSGVLLVSRDAGRSFTLVQQADYRGLAAVLALGTDALVVVGEGGARRIGLGAPARPGAAP